MPRVPLPTCNGDAPTIVESSEHLDVFLAMPGDPLMQARLGTETVQEHTASRLRLKGERFAAKDGWVQGLRWMALEETTGQPLAVLNLTLRKRGRSVQAIVSNLFVVSSRRRQGLANALISEALAVYPQLEADTALTVASAALFDVHAPRPSRRPGLG